MFRLMTFYIINIHFVFHNPVLGFIITCIKIIVTVFVIKWHQWRSVITTHHCRSCGLWPDCPQTRSPAACPHWPRRLAGSECPWMPDQKWAWLLKVLSLHRMSNEKCTHFFINTGHVIKHWKHFFFKSNLKLYFWMKTQSQKKGLKTVQNFFTKYVN